MVAFHTLFAAAAERKGGPKALELLLGTPQPTRELIAIPDARWLSALSRCVFSAGFNWSVVEQKWPGFEESFQGFDPGRCAMMEDEALEKAAKKGGIGHVRKAISIRENAVFFRELAKDHGSAARFFAGSPPEGYVDLLETMKKRGDRLGGMTAQYFLRMMGVDGFMLTRDVCAALVREGVVDKAPTSKRDLAATQAAFDRWRAESDRPLMQISRVLAFTVG